MRRITGHHAKKNGKFYAVINLYDANGKRHQKWINLELSDAKRNDKEAKERVGKILEKYNENHSYLVEFMTPQEREAYRIAKLPIEEFLTEWLSEYKLTVSEITYANYWSYLNGHVKQYFKDNPIKVGEVTEKAINDFYVHLHNQGLKNNSIIRYHAFLHVAFKSLIPKGVFFYNPIGLANKPKAEKPIVKYYNQEQLKKLLEISKDSDLYLIILIAVFYGLRRSEIIGIKWSAIDFSEGDNGTITVCHTVNQKNGRIIKADLTKTDSSYITMPLLPNVREALIKEKEKQTRMKELFGKGYYKGDAEYVFVDPLGHLIKPDDVTREFSLFTEKKMDKRMTMHALRHSCASCMLSSKTPMKNIQVWLGHSDMGTTANTYSHVDSRAMDETAETIYSVLVDKTKEKD